MKILIAQLSDIHVEGEAPVCQRADLIAQAILGADPTAMGCLLAYTGDIAFGGQAPQYAVASALLDGIRSSLSRLRGGIQVKEAFVPGNHDCLLPEKNRKRTVLIEDVLKEPITSPASDFSSVEDCLTVQDDFYRFLAERQGGEPLAGTARLYSDHEFLFGGFPVLVRCFNTAWLSQRHEHPGKLLAPVWIDPPVTTHHSLVVTLFHHPYGWLEPNNAKRFRKQVDGFSDIILTGHEHVPDQYQKQTLSGESVSYLEGAVLQERGSSESGFNVVLVDLSGMTQKEFFFSWSGEAYRGRATSQERPLQRNKLVGPRQFDYTPEFSKYVSDPGAAFSHPQKSEIKLRDLFVYPDLTDTSNTKGKAVKASVRVVRSHEFLDYIRKHDHILVLGRERAGKSSLVKMLHADLHAAGSVPLRVSGEAFRNQDEASVFRAVDKAVAEQYGPDMVERYRQLDPASRVLLVDDFQRCRLNKKGLAVLLDLLNAFFVKTVVIGSEALQYAEIATPGTDQSPLLSFRHCWIREFGHRLRGRLIERWLTLGSEFLTDDLDVARKVKETEHLVDTLLGKNILPSYPIFILSILQSCEANSQHNTALGSFGYHYEALITGALSQIPANITLDTLYTYLSHLAYAMLNAKRKYLHEEEVAEITDRYRQTHRMKFGSTEVLSILSVTRIFGQGADEKYRFNYKYIYYYFAAKYIQTNLYASVHRDELRALIDHMTDKLYVEDYANIIIFLMYLTKDEETINLILKKSRALYENERPFDYDADFAFLDKLGGNDLPLLIENGRAQEHQDQRRARMDEAQPDPLPDSMEDDDIEAEERRELDDWLRINVALKNLQILGQILRNFPGALEGEQKLQIATATYMLGLRLLQSVIRPMRNRLEDMRTGYAEMIRERLGIKDQKELAVRADDLLSNLVLMASYGVLRRVSQAVGSEHLSETFKEVTDDSVPIAIGLMDVSIKLDHYSKFPEREILQVLKKVEQKYPPRQLLRQMVHDFFYLYPENMRLRQSICTKLGISYNQPQMIGSRDKKLLS